VRTSAYRKRFPYKEIQEMFSVSTCSHNPLFRKMFSIIQKPFTKNIFRKTFHTPHNSFRNPFSRYEYYNNLIPTLHSIRNTKTEVTYLPLTMMMLEKLSLQHPPRGRWRMSTPLNSSYYIIFF